MVFHVVYTFRNYKRCNTNSSNKLFTWKYNETLLKKLELTIQGKKKL